MISVSKLFKANPNYRNLFFDSSVKSERGEIQLQNEVYFNPFLLQRFISGSKPPRRQQQQASKRIEEGGGGGGESGGLRRRILVLGFVVIGFIALFFYGTTISGKQGKRSSADFPSSEPRRRRRSLSRPKRGGHMGRGCVSRKVFLHPQVGFSVSGR